MIDFHADDFALFPSQSRRILECFKDGVLKGVSVMTNGPYLEECMKTLKEEASSLMLTVHLNFYEGKALSGTSILTDENGVFNKSFVTLVLASYLPGKRKAFFPAVKKEVKLQTEKLMPWLDGEKLRIDGHGHYHMIPVVFDAITELIDEENWDVGYIRLPYEKIGMYVKNRKELTGFKPINLVKVLIMNHFVRRNQRKYPALFAKLPKTDFSGIMFSGNMRYENASVIVRELGDNADVTEILFHPGDVREKEDIARITNENDLAFLTDEGRRREYDALHRLKDAQQFSRV